MVLRAKRLSDVRDVKNIVMTTQVTRNEKEENQKGTIDMEDFTFKVSNAEEFEQAQKYLFSQGIGWIHSGYVLQSWVYEYCHGEFTVENGVIINVGTSKYPEKQLTVTYSFEPVKVRETIAIVGKISYYLDELKVALENIKHIVK